MAKAIMIQGAGSNVGKSTLVAGLARLLKQRGISAAPFKPQNMSNNAAVTADGGEIGRAQALQALAAGLDPLVDMNPVLLKPQSETGAQVVVQGQMLRTASAREFAGLKSQLMPSVLQSFHRLAKTHDVVLIEGAGSPAEVNLRDGDIANMGFAEAADVPVVIVGDIDRGGVIAQLVGTAAVLSNADKKRIKAFVVNKFRGDPGLFSDGAAEIARQTGWRDLGVLPWFSDARLLPAEDILDLPKSSDGKFRIAVPQLARIANFDDLDPLSADPGVAVDIIAPGSALPGDADLVLIPGSKSTISDLAAFRANGWDIDLAAHIRRGGHVIGICGGYQMLGQAIADPDGIEGTPRVVAGLGHLNVHTTMRAAKRLGVVQATDIATGKRVSGYEIHIGETVGPDCENAWLNVKGSPHGATDQTGRIRGCYLHGLFVEDSFRNAILTSLGAVPQLGDYASGVQETLEALAAHLQAHLDVDGLLECAAEIPGAG